MELSEDSVVPRAFTVTILAPVLAFHCCCDPADTIARFPYLKMLGWENRKAVHTLTPLTDCSSNFKTNIK